MTELNGNFLWHKPLPKIFLSAQEPRAYLGVKSSSSISKVGKNNLLSENIS